MLPNVRNDNMLAISQAVDRLEAAWLPALAPDESKYYAYHGLLIHEFLRGLDECGEPGKFMDLGCGIGTKVFLAYLKGWESFGVEHYESYAESARKLVPECTIFSGEALDFDLYEYDVVYSYRLLVDLDEQHEFSRRIVDRMRPGALYFCAGSDPVDLRVEQLSQFSSVWRVK